MDENNVNLEKNETDQEEISNNNNQQSDKNHGDEPKYYTNHEQNNRMYTNEKKLNTMAVVGFISSLVFFIPFSDLAGLIISIIGLRDAARKDEGGKGMAIAGIIISSLRLVFSFLIIIIFIIAFASGNYDSDFRYNY